MRRNKLELGLDYNLVKLNRRGRIPQMRGSIESRLVKSLIARVQWLHNHLWADLSQGWLVAISVAHYDLQLLPGSAMKVPVTCVRALKGNSHLLGTWRAPLLRLL